MIKSRAYHPHKQENVKRSRRTLGKAINYGLIKHEQKDVSWVKNLLEYTKCLNKDKCEELIYHFPSFTY